MPDRPPFATLLDWMEASLALATTSEPVEIGTIWRNAGVVTLSVGIPPGFTTHPLSQTLNEGDTVTFSWAATNAISFQLQKQEGGVGAWANVSGATSSPWTSAALTNAADNADVYRVVATGIGGTTNSNSAALTVYAPAPLTGITASVAISPQYLVPAWQLAGRATVYVEKGWASGVFQNLYPHTDYKLYTAAAGAGTEASVWAAGSRLFVTTPYNQCLASEGAGGHPTAVTDNTRRVLLDVSIANAPRFAGIQQGTQDGSQNATERGYDLNVSVTPSTGLIVITLDGLPATGTTDYRPSQNNGGATSNILVNPANNRWYSDAVAVTSINPLRMPALKAHYQDAAGERSTHDVAHGIAGGAFHGNVTAYTVSGISTPLRIWGPTSPLTGPAYAFIVVSGSYLAASVMKPTGTLIPRLHKASMNVYGANDLTVYWPKQYTTYKQTLTGTTGTIKIRCASTPLRAIEASFNGGAYAGIGTTDSSGYLNGSLVGQTKGEGTLSIRVVGQGSAAATVANVRIGPMVVRAGQSNADGRGDDITLSVTRTLVSFAVANSTATQKSWLWALLQDLGTTHSAPVCMGGDSAGATYLCFGTGGLTGHWNAGNIGVSNVSNFAKLCAHAHTQDEEPNFCVWHQGEEDSANAVTKADYKAALIAMWTEFRVRSGWTINLHCMIIGRNSSVTDTQVDAIRYATIEAINENPTLLSMGGSIAHLVVGDGGTDNVHLWTQAQKNATVAIFKRHVISGGGGRAHRYSSSSKTTTTVTLNFTAGSGNLVPGASPTIGWTCTDGSGSLTVSSASVGTNQIILTMSRTIVGSILVKWCSHFTGVTCTIRDSDATTPLPPEPFEVTV